jgi:hypothetical protein
VKYAATPNDSGILMPDHDADREPEVQANGLPAAHKGTYRLSGRAAGYGAVADLLIHRVGRRRFDQMSLPRFAAWGAVGGILLSGIFVVAAGLGGDGFLVLGPVFALSGAGSAAGSLALARMAEDRELLDASADGDLNHGFHSLAQSLSS